MGSNGATDTIVAIIGNLKTHSRGSPKYGIYVTADGHGLILFTREFRGRVRDRLILNGQATDKSIGAAWAPKSFLRFVVAMMGPAL
jgi:intracellular sulfur oxidation DsrE/DsrF family protein